GPRWTPQQLEALHAGMLEVRALERGGDRAGAIQKAQKLLQQFPAERRVEDALLDLYRQEHRDDAVIGLLRARVKRDPQDIDSGRDLASLLLARDATAEALDLLKKFAAANPKDEHRYRIAATLLLARGQADAAAQFYRQGRQAIGVESLFAAELAQIERQRGDLGAALGELMLLAEDPDRRGRSIREIED